MSRRCQSDMFLFDSSVLCRGAIGEVGWIVGLIVAAVGAVYARPVLLLLIGLGTLILFVLGNESVLCRGHCRLHVQSGLRGLCCGTFCIRVRYVLVYLVFFHLGCV